MRRPTGRRTSIWISKDSARRPGPTQFRASTRDRPTPSQHSTTLAESHQIRPIGVRWGHLTKVAMRLRRGAPCASGKLSVKGPSRLSVTVVTSLQDAPITRPDVNNSSSRSLDTHLNAPTVGSNQARRRDWSTDLTFMKTLTNAPSADQTRDHSPVPSVSIRQLMVLRWRHTFWLWKVVLKVFDSTQLAT